MKHIAKSALLLLSTLAFATLLIISGHLNHLVQVKGLQDQLHSHWRSVRPPKQHIFTTDASHLKPESQHQYRSDGLLDVNLRGLHPIFDLIGNGKKSWEEKLSRASKTLEEAISEYIRRYGRSPPRGFDVWWDYAMKHSVQLPDEYDGIHDNLEAFWAIDPQVLRDSEEFWEREKGQYLVAFGKISTGPVEILQNLMTPLDKRPIFSSRIQKIVDWIQEFSQFLPEFRALMTPHDNPGNLWDWKVKLRALEAAANGTYIDVQKERSREWGWRAACPPDSPAHTSFEYNITAPFTGPKAFSSSKSFIHDHKMTMDPCLHPYHLVSSSQFLSNRAGGPTPHQRLFPSFAQCSTMLHYDLLPVPSTGYPNIDDDLEWEAKYDERLMWRGSASGMYHEVDGLWRQSQRERLVELMNQMTGNLEILRPVDEHAAEGNSSLLELDSWPAAYINPAMVDVAFAGKPTGCKERACKELADEYEWRNPMSIAQARRYKYVMDVDGNGWSSRFRRLLSTNSLIFKSTLYPEWFIDRIQPWVHYIPIQTDYSDLHDALIFFRGDLKGEGSHDHLAKQIALAGAEWTRSFWREEDIKAYMFRFFLEYSRIMSLDREAMTHR